MSSHIPSVLACLFLAPLFAACGDAQTEPISQRSDDLVKQSIELSTGITMKYIELGDSAGKPVIFLHGYTDSSRSFYPTMQALVKKSPALHLFALDLRGHGGSSMPDAALCAQAPEGCFMPSQLAEDVVAFLSAKGMASASIVGHSMGSLIAQELLIDHSALVERAVLIGTSPNLTENVVLNEFFVKGVFPAWQAAVESKGLVFPKDAYELTPYDVQPDTEAWMAMNWVADPVADPAFLSAIVPETSSVRLGTWLGAAFAMLKFDNRKRLEGITTPTLTIWATQDGLFLESPDQAELRASLDVAVTANCSAAYYWKQYGKAPLPPSGLQESDIGHNVQWGAPNEVATDIAAYLDTGAPTSDLYYAAPGDIQRIITELGAAKLFGNVPAKCP